MTVNIDRLKAERRIELRAQQRAEAQVRRSQFQHDQALARIAFSAEEAKARLAYKHDTIIPELEKLDQQVLGSGE